MKDPPTSQPRVRGSALVAGVALAVVALAACRSVAQPGAAPPPPPSESLGNGHGSESLSAREMPLETRVDAAAPLSSVAPPPRWSKLPETSGELFSVVDGPCPNLHVSFLENETLLTFGRYTPTFARVTDDAITVDASLTKGLGEVHDIEAVMGHWPDRTYVAYGAGNRCDFGEHALRWDNGKWTSAFALPGTLGVKDVRTYGGGAIGLRECIGGCGDPDPSCVPGVFMGDNAKAPPMTGDGFRADSYETLPTGEVYALGAACTTKERSACDEQLRWWSPGSKVGYVSMGKPSEHLAMLVKSSSEIYVAHGEVFSRFDGTKLTRLKSPPGKVTRIADSKDGLWLEADRKLWLRAADETFQDVSPPGYGEKSWFTGTERGAPWAVVKGALYKRVGGAWQDVALPRPPFSSTSAYLTPTRITVRAPDDVYVFASYFEQKPGWNEVEPRTTLLRTRRPRETLRCSSASGLESWPAQAGDGCTSPFVVLAPVSATSPRDYDYPRTRAVMRPKAALTVDNALTEIRENGKVWIGMVPRSLADGRALAELYATQFPMTRPEVVCLEPSAPRKIPLR